MAKKRLGDASVRQILTVDRVAYTPEEKKSIKSGHECCAVDMESAIAASVASRHGVPFVVIRSIVDDCNCAIPKVLADIVQEDGQPDIFALAQKAIKQPRLIVSAIDLGMRSRRAALSLSLFLTDYLQK
jgi:nucleoside phosphorylase